MRIILLDTKPVRRGAQVFLYDLANQFLKDGVSVKRIYLFKNEHSISLPMYKDDEFLNGDEKNFYEKLLTIQPSLVVKLARSIRSFRPDLILLNGSYTLKYGAAVKRILGNHLKFVYRVIDSPSFWNTSPIKKWYYKKLVIPAVDGAVAVSNASLTDMKTLYNFSKMSTVIHRAINFNSFEAVPDKQMCRKRLGVSPTSKVVLFAGNITKQKRPDRFIEIIKQLKNDNPDVKAWIVGDGPLREYTENLVQLSGLSSCVTFWGYQQQIGTFMSAADLLILPSDSEGLPGVVLEAAYFGVPSVAANVGGINECIQSGKNGFIVDKNDIKEYITKLDLLLAENELCLEMGKAAKENVLAHFDIRDIAKDYLSFFYSLCNN